MKKKKKKKKKKKASQWLLGSCDRLCDLQSYLLPRDILRYSEHRVINRK